MTTNKRKLDVLLLTTDQLMRSVSHIHAPGITLDTIKAIEGDGDFDAFLERFDKLRRINQSLPSSSFCPAESTLILAEHATPHLLTHEDDSDKISKRHALMALNDHFGEKLSHPCSTPQCLGWTNAAQAWIVQKENDTGHRVICPSCEANYIGTRYKHRTDIRVVETWLYRYKKARGTCGVCGKCEVWMWGNIDLCHKIQGAGTDIASVADMFIGSAKCKLQCDLNTSKPKYFLNITPSPGVVTNTTFLGPVRKELMSISVKKSSINPMQRIKSLLSGSISENSTIRVPI